ncbi:MAG: hypothetical protein IKT08_09795 [Bacteroidales bacterium]|nr:hypothetical protein [Bacteroidales bacterium]
MKIHLFKAAALCVIATFLSACNKESTTQLIPNKNNEKSPLPIEQLRTFQKQMEAVKAHPDQRSQETLSLPDALWDVENLFNLTYSDPNQYYSQTTDHEFILTLPVNNSQEVDVVDAANLYNQIIEEARLALISDPSETTGFVSLIIEQPETTYGYAQVKCIGKTGERCNYNLPTTFPEGPFDPSDNWLFAAPMGKCDDPDIPSGADKQLQEKLHDQLIEDTPEAPMGYRNIYINRKRFVFDGVNTPGVFYTQNPEDICIDFQGMNTLFKKEKVIISTTIPEQYHLYNYAPVSIEISGIQTEDGSGLTHRNEVEYGLLYQVSKDEFGEVKDLLQP